MTAKRITEIRRTLRHAQATRSTEGDSWLNGYQQDVAYLLSLIDPPALDPAKTVDDESGEAAT